MTQLSFIEVFSPSTNPYRQSWLFEEFSPVGYRTRSDGVEQEIFAYEDHAFKAVWTTDGEEHCEAWYSSTPINQQLSGVVYAPYLPLITTDRIGDTDPQRYFDFWWQMSPSYKNYQYELEFEYGDWSKQLPILDVLTRDMVNELELQIDKNIRSIFEQMGVPAKIMKHYKGKKK